LVQGSQGSGDSGEISPETLQDGSLFKAFLFDGAMGDTVTVSLTSQDFNAYVLFADPRDSILGFDDNGNGSCDARINYVLPETGQYAVYATSTTPGEYGEFQIALTRGNRTPAANDPCAGFLEWKGDLSVGDSIMGTLGPPDGKVGPSYYQVWRLRVPVGDTVTVDLVSDDFDARLTLYQGYATAVAADDDGGGKCNARVVLTGSAHSYRIVMTTGKEEETGSYVLRMVPGALPVTTESACQG